MSDNQNLKLLIRKSAGMRLLVLFGSFFFLLLISSAISMGIESLGAGTLRDRQLWMSTVQNLLAFCLPAFILATFSSERPLKWLYFENRPGLKPFIGVIIVYIITIPAMEWIITWNSNISFPESMEGLEKILRQWEDSSNDISTSLLAAENWWEIVLGVIVIGLLTGFSEEIFFRGGFQGILMRTQMGAMTAIWASAILFSTLHFQFYGFIPRMLMGAFFGYLLWQTKSIWVPVFAHALNNSTIVIIAGTTGKDSVYPDALTSDFASIGMPCISLFLSLVFFIYLRRYFFFTPHNILSNGEKEQYHRI